MERDKRLAICIIILDLEIGGADRVLIVRPRRSRGVLDGVLGVVLLASTFLFLAQAIVFWIEAILLSYHGDLLV